MRIPKRAKRRYTKSGFIVSTWTGKDGHVVIDVPFSDPKDEHKDFFRMEEYTE